MGTLPRSRSDRRGHAKDDESLFVDGPRGLATGGEDVLAFVSLQTPESAPLLGPAAGLESEVSVTLSTASSFSRGSEGTPPDRQENPLDDLPMPRLGKKQRAVERREERKRKEAESSDEPIVRTTPTPREPYQGGRAVKRTPVTTGPLCSPSSRKSPTAGVPFTSNETVLDYLIKSIARVLERIHQRMIAKPKQPEINPSVAKQQGIPNLQRQTTNNRKPPGISEKRES